MEKTGLFSKIKDTLLGFRKKTKKFPSFWQWKQVLGVLTKKEKILFFIFFAGSLGATIFLVLNLYLENTEIKPAAGSAYIEGVVGQPIFINPILATGDVDRDLIELLFSGLMKYNEKGEVIPDLAEDYEIKQGGRVYEFRLREGVFWHDNAPLTADDIVFTIETIQDPDYKSPERVNWLGVEVRKVSDQVVRFTLKNPYGPFLERTTIKILPKHIWQDVSPQNWPLAVQYNLQPIGSGPYKFEEIHQEGVGNIKSLTLVANPDYFGKTPYISKIIFSFFETEEDLIGAAQRNKVQGFSLLNPKDRKLLGKGKFLEYRLSLPRYFAVFFRTEELYQGRENILAEKKVRQALNLATDKEEVLDKVLDGEGRVAHSPILPEIYGFNPPSEVYEFSLEKAEEMLQEAGFEKENGKLIKKVSREAIYEFKNDLEQGDKGEEVRALQKCLAQDPEVYPEAKITGYFGPATKQAVIRFQEKYKEEILDPWGFKKGTGLVGETTRAKLNKLCGEPSEELVPLKLSLVTPDQAFLVETANILEEQWQKLGLDIEIRTSETSQLARDFIKPRDYEGLLFGQVLGGIPDLFPFWHSTWREDPGLNLTSFESKTADNLLEEARKSSDPEARSANYQKFQEILIEEAPAVFLYSPDYVYLISPRVKGIDGEMITAPSKRFTGIENWYIETRRVWK